MKDLAGTPYAAEFTGLYEPDHSEVIVVACHRCHIVAPVTITEADAEAVGEGRETLATVAWNAVADEATLKVAMGAVREWAEYYDYEAREELPETCTH